MTESDFQRVATAHLDLSKLAIVVSGDAKSLVPMLRATHVGRAEPCVGYSGPLGSRARRGIVP